MVSRRLGPIGLAMIAVSFVLAAFAANVSAAGFSVTNYGAKCDGATDDTAAINATIEAAEAACESDSEHQMHNQSYIELPTASSCIITSGLTINAACVGLESNGATLDASRIPSGSTAITITTSQATTPFGENTPPWNGVHLIGPGSGTNSIGLYVEAGAVMFSKPNISNFGVGVEFGNNSFLDRFESSMIWDCGTGIIFPSGLSNAGENLTFQGGSIFGSTTGVQNSGGAEINLEEVSFDGLSGAALLDQRGIIRAHNLHIEYYGPISVSPVEVEGGCNAWTFIQVSGGIIQNNSGNTTNVRSTVDIEPSGVCGGSGPWVSIEDAFLAGLNPSAACVRGSGATCVTGTTPSTDAGPAQVVFTTTTSGAGGGTFGNANLQ